MPVFTIIGGVNGAGKTSFTGVIRGERRDLGIIIDVDKLSAEAGGDMMAGAKTAVHKIEECLQCQVNFTQETTLSGHKTLATIKRAKELGYFVRLYYIGLDGEQEHIQRIGNRVSKGGHDIKAEDVKRRYTERFTALLNVLPYCDQSVFYDNSNGFLEVAEYVNGGIITKGSYRPAWLDQLVFQHMQCSMRS